MTVIDYIEITYPFGRRELVPTMAYVQMTLEALAGTRVRTLTRSELIARRWTMRKSS